MHNEVHVSVHECTVDYLRCTNFEVHDRVRKHVIRCTKKCVPRFLILEALFFASLNAKNASGFFLKVNVIKRKVYDYDRVFGENSQQLQAGKET